MQQRSEHCSVGLSPLWQELHPAHRDEEEPVQEAVRHLERRDVAHELAGGDVADDRDMR